MRRLGAVFALALTIGLATGPARGADEPNDQPRDTKSSATVGVRTGNAQGGDDRGVYKYEILPKGVVQDWVAVSNYRHEPITVRLLARDATSDADSVFAVQRSEERPEDVGAWIALKKNKLTIPPRREVVVPFQLGVPHNATPGDHAGAIVVSLLAKEPKPGGGTIIVDHRVGMRIHLRVPGDLNPELSVEDVQVRWNGAGDLLGRGPATVSYTVRNTGNVRMNATGDVELTRMLGLPPVVAEADPVEEILPGGSMTFTRTIENVFGSGPMDATVDLQSAPVDEALADRGVDVSGSGSFSAYPWLLIGIVVGLLVLLIGGGGWMARRRRKTRTRQLQPAPVPAADGDVKTGSLVLRTIGIATLALVWTATPAHAADDDTWQAKLTAKQGTSNTAFDFLTSGGCPDPATNVVGYGYGAGFPREGAVVVSNSSADVSNEWPFQMPLLDTMYGLMLLQPNPQPLKGVYKLVLRCIEAEWPDRSLGEYVVAIRFDNRGNWKVEPPLTREHGPTAEAPSAGANGEPSGGAPQDSPADGNGTRARGGAEDGGAGGEPLPGETTDAQDRAEELLAESDEAATQADDPSGVSWPLMAAGIGVLVAVGLLLTGRLPGPWRRL